MAADIVHQALLAALKDQVDGGAVILHIQPIPHVQALSVHRQRLVRSAVGNHQGDQLFRKLVRTVVIGAAADGNRQTIGAEIGVAQQVRRGLGGRIGAGGVDRGLLRKEQVRPVQRQISVHLIGGDLVVAADAENAAGVQKYLGTHHVGLQENSGIFD